MPSKLGFHLQQKPGWCFDLIRDSGTRYVKIMDPSSDNQFPNQRTIARTYLDDNPSNQLVAQGARGGEEWFRLHLPAYERSPWVYAWEGPNEPPVSTTGERFALREFTKTWVQLMHQRNWKTVAFNFSVSWPIGETGYIFGPALAETDFVGFHEYSAPTMQHLQGALCFHYRQVLADWRACNMMIPQIFITECGIDGGVIDRARTGYHSYCNDLTYLSQLIWYDQGLQEDPEVEAGFIFTSGANGDWQDFDVQEPMAQLIRGYVNSVPKPEEPKPQERPLPEQEPAQLPELLAQKVRWWLEEYTRQLETNPEYAKAILFSLINYDRGLLYRLERALQG